MEYRCTFTHVKCMTVLYRLLDMVRESFGNDAARSVMAVDPNNLPIMLIVFKSKGQVEVRNVIQGVLVRLYTCGCMYMCVNVCAHEHAHKHACGMCAINVTLYVMSFEPPYSSLLIFQVSQRWTY